MTSRRAAVLPVDHSELEGDDKSDEASCSLPPAEQNRSVGLSSLTKIKEWIGGKCCVGIASVCAATRAVAGVTRVVEPSGN